MDQVKEAFSKVKEEFTSVKNDIEILNKNLLSINEERDLIHQELFNLRGGFNDIRSQIILINETLSKLLRDINIKKEEAPSFQQTHPSIYPANQHIVSTGNDGVPTHLLPINPQNAQIYPSSTGNDGVPTDRQTDKQTNQQTHNGSYNLYKGSYNPQNESSLKKEDSIENALSLLNSLDNIKKEIRLKFKKLTDQEVLVFSTLYQFDEEKGFSDYRALSEKLNLSESSIRDYVGKLIQKGIPIEKIKVNNKNIQLKISSNLKKIASLPTILQLRDI